MPKLSISHPLITGLTLGLGVGLSVMAALFVGRWEASTQQGRFQRQIENLATALQRSLNRYTDVLAFLGDYYRVAEGQVSRAEFDTFAARSLQLYPGIQALEWAPQVTQAERLAFEQAVQAEGYPSFQIMELAAGNHLVRAGERPYYIPVNYIAPWQNNEVAFGFDLTSNPARTAAIETARDQGKVTATSPIRLVQEPRDQYGFLVFLPRYQTGTIPPDLPSRRAQFEGFLLGVFRVADVVEESLQDLRHDINFVMADRGAGDESQVLGHYDSAQQTVTTQLPRAGEQDLRRSAQSRLLCPSPADCTRSLTVGDRQWQVAFYPADHYVVSTAYGAPITLLVGLLLTASLVSFLHNLNRELVGTKTLSDLKLRFFSMASHELRTPLSTIVLSAESLRLHQDDWPEEQKRANIQRIYLTAKRMGQQITDMLTLTRAEVGKLEFNPELVEVEPLCRQIIEDLEGGEQSRIGLTGTGQVVKAFWDKKLVRSLLSNLLSNALKYSPEGSPIELVLHYTGQTATLEVRDRGLGIPAAEQQAVQEAFHRGSNVGDIPGTGLGLAVVNTGVELHRGTWAMESTEGQGTTVRVTLPLE